MTQEPLQTGFDPSDRELCPDGACIGVIGDDGRCAECGKGSAKNTPSAGRKVSNDDAPPPTAALPTAMAAEKSTPAGPREVEGDDFDPDRRELCPDGACIGVIGSDGQCAECGKSASSGSRAPATTSSTPSHDEGSEADADSDSDPASTDQDDKSDESSDDPPADDERELCPDGACIGVIGSNGRCKVCGTRAE